MGMVSHEAPRLTDRGRCLIRTNTHAKPCRSGMSGVGGNSHRDITRGFIKLEDTVVVTDQGHEVYGEARAAGTGRASASVSSWPGLSGT